MRSILRSTLSNRLGWFRHRRRVCGVACAVALLGCTDFSGSSGPPPDNYVGHLGGVPVKIPRPYGRFLEYDGDPHFMEKRKGAAPKRDYSSGIRGFAFEVHFPDMAVLDVRNRDATPKETMTTRRWMRVLVWANSDFEVDSETYMVRLTNEVKVTGVDPYREEPEPVYGLRSFSKIKDSEKHVGGSGERRYLEVGGDGKTLTHISCTVSVYASSSCSMIFVLDPAMHAKVQVSFRKGLLEDWREIKRSASEVMLGFVVANEQVKESQEFVGRSKRGLVQQPQGISSKE
jgi:hypothetical protein